MMHKFQRGYTLIELILVVGLISSMTLLSFLEKSADLEIQQARVTGEKLLQYNNAVRSWLSNNVGAQNDTLYGSSWLKHTSCQEGLSNIAYLPCDFPIATDGSPIKFGTLSIRSNITTSGTAPDQITKITTITSPFITPSGKNRSDLAGVATIVAAAGGLKSNTPVVMATDASFGSDPETGVITMVSGNNANVDAWLRTDGSNTMKSNLTFEDKNPDNLREIKNISRIQSIASSILYIGRPNGSIADEKVLIDANARVMGGLRVSNSSGGASAVTIDKGDLSALEGNIVASKSIQAGENVSAKMDVVAGGDLYGQKFYDADDKEYFIDPNLSSNLSELTVVKRMKLKEYLQIDSIVTEGEMCEKSGLVSIDSIGGLLTCQSGIWKQPGSASGGGFSTNNFQGQTCRDINPRTGACSCPPGLTPFISGGGYSNTAWDIRYYICN